MLGDAFGSLGGLEQTNHDDGVDVETEATGRACRR